MKKVKAENSLGAAGPAPWVAKQQQLLRRLKMIYKKEAQLDKRLSAERKRLWQERQGIVQELYDLEHGGNHKKK
jgi:hypothetical protein